MTGNRQLLTGTGRRALWVAVGIVLLVVGPFASSLRAKPAEYLQDDASITGEQINTFAIDGKPVTIVTGGFRLSIGPRTISARNAVLWIDTLRSGEEILHDITAYLEDDAQVVEADGSTTTDRMMLIKAYVQGRITASGGTVSSRDLANLPLYQRALDVRQQDRRMRQALRARQEKYRLATGSDDPLTVHGSAREPAPAAAPDRRRQEAAPADTPSAMPLETLASPAGGRLEPAPTGEATSPIDEPTLSASTTQTARPRPAEPPQPVPPAMMAVHFESGGGVRILKDKDDSDRRIAIAKGKVYLSQGPRDSLEFMELRADSAVVFTRVGVEQDQPNERTPYQPPMIGLSGGGETAEGVYLEGDVILTRGERKMTAEACYYDFLNQRAVVLKPVFRTIQEQRNIPIYVRASKARVLSPRETKFYDAVVSTSDFSTPTYALGAEEVTFRDETPYDAEGERLAQRRYSTDFRNATWDVRGVPVFWAPAGRTEFEQGHSPLRKLTAGRFGGLGWGAESEWHLFRLLGLVEPEGTTANVIASGYTRGAHLGVDAEYQRRDENRQYSGYFKVDGIYDREAEDTFGDERQDIPAKHLRGRVLARHKEVLPRDWMLQGEMSLICDRNFLEEFFPSEFWLDKPQENLLYAKKQRDNWAVTALLKARLNDFLTQTEAYPEVAGYLTGQSLLEDRITYFGEARAGVKRYRDDHEDVLNVDSPPIARFDTRHEINMPLAIQTGIGPLNVVPYAAGRLTYWSATPNADEQLRLSRNTTFDDYARTVNAKLPNSGGGEEFRAYGEGGIRANMNFWRVYPNVESRLWDIHKLRHIITPEVIAFGSAAGNVYPDQLYPLDPYVEESIQQNAGGMIALRQRLQTKRGPQGKQRTVDWMRFDISVGYFQNPQPGLPADGRLFASRPEYSLQRSFWNMEYTWNISDSMALLADMNYDLGNGRCERINVGLAVSRSPRLSYYAGIRYIQPMDSTIGTVGFSYKINKKYMIHGREQYDFTYRDGINLSTQFSIIRKFPRWYAGVTFKFDSRQQGEDEYTILLALWPEGIPEARLGVDTGMFNDNDENADDN